MKLLFLLALIVGAMPASYLAFCLFCHRVHSSELVEKHLDRQRSDEQEVQGLPREVIDYAQLTFPVRIFGFEMSVSPLLSRTQLLCWILLVVGVALQLACGAILLWHSAHIPRYAQ